MRQAEESSSFKISGWKATFGDVSETLSHILAPLIIFTYLRDSHDNVDYVFQHPRISIAFSVLVGCLFLATVMRRCRGRVPTRATEESSQRDSASTVSEPPAQGRRIVLVLAMTMSAIAVVLLVGTCLLVFSRGVYYPVIASVLGHDAAVREVLNVNEILKQEKAEALRARAYKSAGSGWYMIALAGPHLTEQSAKRTLEEGRAVLGRYVGPDAWVYNTTKWSLRRRVRWVLQKGASLIGLNR